MGVYAPAEVVKQESIVVAEENADTVVVWGWGNEPWMLVEVALLLQ